MDSGCIERPSPAGGGAGWRRMVLVCAVATLLPTMLPGCGPAPTVVSGTVTLDGRPIQEGIVQFFPVAGDGQTQHAITGKDGSYRAKVSPVPMVVVIKKPKVVGQTRMFPDSPPVDEMAESLPPRYSDRVNTELRVTPIPGKTSVADFALKSDER